MNPAKAYCACVLLLAACGCHWNRSQPQPTTSTIIADRQRDAEEARRQNDEAVQLLERGDESEAEKRLKASLTADNTFGPAHNNLGALYLRQKKFYQAASEFQAAAAMMPNKADPRCNLGLVYETVGKMNEAASAYEEALKIESNSAEATGNLARIYVRMGRKDDRTRQLLNEVIMKDSRPDWVSWARQSLALMSATEPAASGSAPRN